MLHLKPKYDHDNGLCYKRYRMVIFAAKVVSGAVCVNTVTTDLLPANYYDNYRLGKGT